MYRITRNSTLFYRNESIITESNHHKFIKSYSTALVKRQWGTNLIKFDGMTLPGGVTVNARQIYEDALQDIEKIMEKFREEEDEGPIFFVG